MTPEEWQFLTQQGVHTTNPVQPLTEEQASVAKIPLYMTPIVGQGLAGYDAYHSARQGNYGTAAAEAAMGFLPVHKPVLAALNAIKRNALPVAAAGAVTALPTDAEAAPSYNGIEGLYSRMAEAVKGWSGKNTGANWLGRLKNEPGVPGAELKWFPARKWLETSGEKPISAEELRAYIDSNPIPISQKTLGDRDNPRWTRGRTRESGAVEWHDSEDPDAGPIGWRPDYNPNESRATEGGSGPSLYTSYSLPGELTVELEKLFHFNPQNRKDPKDMSMEEIFQYRNNDVPVDPNYSAPHFPGHSKNLAAHTRTNVRKLHNGEKAYHVEEIQSDWAQTGRDKGFRPDEGWTPDNLPEGYRLEETPIAGRLRRDEPEYALFSRDGEPLSMGLTPQEAVSDARDHLNRVGLPRQPLAEEQKGLPLYGSMAFRKNLYDAAKSGADHMTWTTGKQQAERFPDENNAAGMSQFYDRKMRKIAEIEAKRLGITPEEHLGQQNLGNGKSPNTYEFYADAENAFPGTEFPDEKVVDELYHHVTTGNSRHLANAESYFGGPLPPAVLDLVTKTMAPDIVHSFKLPPELRKQILEKGLPFMGIGAGAKILNEQGEAPAPLDNALPPGA